MDASARLNEVKALLISLQVIALTPHWDIGIFDTERASSSGRNSAVECQLPKLDVVGSSPIARFFISVELDRKSRGFGRRILLRGVLDMVDTYSYDSAL